MSHYHNVTPTTSHTTTTTSTALRNRLLSIRYDVQYHCQPILQELLVQTKGDHEHGAVMDVVLVANERCGTWYHNAIPLLFPTTTTTSLSQCDNNNNNNNIRTSSSCCFKSTDGHYGTWNFSLKRLNLHLLRCLVGDSESTTTTTTTTTTLSKNVTVVILDASSSKVYPDSFSRTIPIWAAVLNRIAIRYRRDYHLPPCDHDEEEEMEHHHSFLWTPPGIVTEEEYQIIQQRIPVLVETLYQSRAIVDPKWLATTLRKPLRPFWIAPSDTSLLDQNNHDDITKLSTQYYPIICLSCSDVTKQGQCLPLAVVASHPTTARDSSWTYRPGAADDHESWATPYHWTPERLWKTRPGDDDDTRFDLTIAVSSADGVGFDSVRPTGQGAPIEKGRYHEIGPNNNLRISIGTRSVGCPPTCWSNFDAILNVTEMEYDDMADSCRRRANERRYYLQLPVREGKRDRTELEKYMTWGILFIVVHTKQNRRVLVHCAQGMDRSVAVVMAVMAMFTTNAYPPEWNECYHNFSLDGLVELDNENDNHEGNSPNRSGLSNEVLQLMLGREGRDRLFDRVWPQWRHDDHHVDKDSLRITLQLVRQYHDRANPSRATIQKLHRYFCSTTDT